MNKSASMFTKQANTEFLKKLPFEDVQDFEDARRGLIAETPDLVIKDAAGDVVWDMKSYYDFLGGGAKTPDTVNPSLWRHEQVCTIAGLFEVTDGVWQVRGYDLANLTLVRSKSGYIIIDVLGTVETARAAMDLAYKHLGKKPIEAIVITHSHGDHFGGLEGVVSAEDVESGKIPVIAPDKFNEETVSENVLAGQAMSRRSCYQFGPELPHGPQGQVGTSVGKTLPHGTTSLVFPNRFVQNTGETITIDGVEMVFQMTPYSEAPTELCLYLPQFRALCMADVILQSLHNLLPFRGAKVRSAKLWSHYLHEALELFGDKTDALFLCHYWPRWGRDRIKQLLAKQRDTYKFINDQTLRRINRGQTMTEIAEEVDLPESLGCEWFNRNYYGHVNHDIKATYQWYLGWYDGNPSHLHELPPTEAGRRYVELMGGPEEVLRKAKASYDKGEYRWVAQLVNNVVFGFPDNAEARGLLADTLEQMGYQAESSTWRNSYLTGAMELRRGMKQQKRPALGVVISMAAVSHMRTELLLDFLATHVDPAKAEGAALKCNLRFTDQHEEWQWTLGNSVMNCWNAPAEDADAAYVMTRATFNAILCKQTSLKDAIASGAVKAKGETEAMDRMLAMFEDPAEFWFNIVMP